MTKERQVTLPTCPWCGVLVDTLEPRVMRAGRLLHEACAALESETDLRDLKSRIKKHTGRCDFCFDRTQPCPICGSPEISTR